MARRFSVRLDRLFLPHWRSVEFRETRTCVGAWEEKHLEPDSHHSLHVCFIRTHFLFSALKDQTGLIVF